MGVRRPSKVTDVEQRQRVEADVLADWWRQRAVTGEPLTAAEFERVERLGELIHLSAALTFAYYGTLAGLPPDGPVCRSLTEHRRARWSRR